jgi:hypothetical protein
MYMASIAWPWREKRQFAGFIHASRFTKPIIEPIDAEDSCKRRIAAGLAALIET